MTSDKEDYLGETLTLGSFCHELFGVEESIVVEALLNSPNARGYILGAVSELLLRDVLKQSGFSVKRIKEKWEGTKIHHGDFYVSSDEKNWFVVESKGLKSNSEKWAKRATKNYYQELVKTKKKSEMKSWFDGLSEELREQLKNERDQDQIRLCQTHMPSGKATNVNKKDKRTQASPRYDEFHLLAVDMFTKTGRHEFVFAVSDQLSRSKKDPNHLLQNYFITLVLPTDLKPLKPLAHPWSEDVVCLFQSLRNPVKVSEMQVDERKLGERAEGVLSF